MNKKAETKSSDLPSIFPGFGPLGSLREEMDRMFHAFSMPQMSWTASPPGSNGSMGLRVDIAETDKAIEVKADLPGVSEEDVNVTLDGDLLRIHAEKKAESEKKDKTWRVTERSYGMFERTIRVPEGIDPKKVDASFEKGVLTVTLPKPPGSAKATPHKIAIQKGK